MCVSEFRVLSCLFTYYCDAQNLLSQPWSEKQNMCGFSSSPDCIPITGCGNAVLAQIFFLTFTLFVSYGFKNLVIAVVLESFSTAE